MREEDLMKYKEEELQTPLSIRVEVARLGDVIIFHHILYF
jgi:hypothetical protein